MHSEGLERPTTSVGEDRTSPHSGAFLTSPACVARMTRRPSRCVQLRPSDSGTNSALQKPGNSSREPLKLRYKRGHSVHDIGIASLIKHLSRDASRLRVRNPSGHPPLHQGVRGLSPLRSTKNSWADISFGARARDFLMPVVQELTTRGSPAPSSGLRLDGARCVLSCPAHLSCMDMKSGRTGDLQPIYSLSEPAAYLGMPQRRPRNGSAGSKKPEASASSRACTVSA